VVSVANQTAAARGRFRAPFPYGYSPEDARWNAERQAVEFGVEISEDRGVVRVPRRVFQRLLPERPTPERCIEPPTYKGPGSRASASGSCAGAQLTQAGNVEISGRDLREWSAAVPELPTVRTTRPPNRSRRRIKNLASRFPAGHDDGHRPGGQGHAG
jgi:hypothetical protein